MNCEPFLDSNVFVTSSNYAESQSTFTRTARSQKKNYMTPSCITPVKCPKPMFCKIDRLILFMDIEHPMETCQSEKRSLLKDRTFENIHKSLPKVYKVKSKALNLLSYPLHVKNSERDLIYVTGLCRIGN